ncbi:phage portal protein [Anaeromassilibacillus senegalensis]|uniref:Phage portal protein n=1 Tax=Anaeromassilibacillus senegalensis TaxID=1673717 RepID=A0ABS9CL28_9FIRM|nr:phage portal protein [Anaeromassilibacillus senegalensis]MCF2651836.1 phage portal protein [Anaeromassilibacillus senegalensis]
MNISTVIDYLNKTYGYSIKSSYYSRIDEWKKWWQGFYEPFHQFVEKHEDKSVNRELFCMKMGKKVCEDWASLLMNDKTRVDAGDINQKFLQGENNVGGLFRDLAFWLRENELIERAWATGTGAAVLRFENMLVENGTVKPDENSRIRVAYLTADSIIPLTINERGVQDVAFASEVTNLGKTYTYIETHILVNGEYEIRNAYFIEENDTLKPVELPPGIVETYRTGSDVPLFSLISPNIVKNISEGKGLGMSILANAIDQLKGVDLAYNNFCRDFKLGGKKVFYDQSLTRTDAQGHTITPDDIAQSLFLRVGDGDGLGDDRKPITEYNPSLRVEENTAGVQAALDYLSLRVGFGTKHYQFNASGSVVTATQYTGDKQDLVQNAAKHCIAVEHHVQQIVRALLWAGKYVLGQNVDPDTSITVEFDDSYIIDKETQKQQFWQYVLSGKFPFWRYLVRFEGYSETDAKEIAQESSSAVGDPYVKP